MKKFTTLILAVAIVAVIIVLLVINNGTKSGDIKNVILISIDTCRADHLSCYGYGKETTPNIDMIAKRGVLFDRAVTTVPLTLPAHSTMLTGTTPLGNGVHSNHEYLLGDFNVTLPEVLGENGFKTGAVVSSFVLDSQFGLNQGFDYYDDEFDEVRSADHIEERLGIEATIKANAWIEENANDKFFLFLHYYDPHFAYDPPEPFKSQFADDPYAGEIAYVDHCIGQVIAQLKKLDLYDSTLLFVVGDHGESLGEHGEKTHGYFIYQSTMHVPMIVSGPQIPKNKIVKDVAGLVDIAPTVYGMLGIEIPEDVEGTDLTNLMNSSSGDEKRYLYMESLEATKLKCNPLLALYDGRWKYIQTTRPELYNIETDYAEQQDLITKDTKRARLIEENLKIMLEEHAKKEQGDSQLNMDAESIKKLETLGYIATGKIDESFTFDNTKPDAKDYIKMHEMSANVMGLMGEEQFDEAAALCNDILKQVPEYVAAHTYLAHIAVRQQRFDEAISHLDDALRIDPQSVEAMEQKATVYYLQKKYNVSIEIWEKVLELRPDWPLITRKVADTYLLTKDYDKAIEYYDIIMQSDPDKLICKYLGIIYQQKDQPDKAIEYFKRSLEFDPQQVEVCNSLGDLSLKAGDQQQAISYFEKSIELRPKQLALYTRVAAIYSSQNNYDKAVELIQKALDIKSDVPQIHNSMALTLNQAGKYDQAAEYYLNSLELKPDQMQIHKDLADVYFRLGKNELAVKHWQKVLEFKPDHASVLNNLAWVLASTEDSKLKDPDEAVKMAIRACKLTENKNVDYMDTLSVAYAAAGNYSAALETLEKAKQLAVSAGLEDSVKEMDKRIELYKAGRSN